jgi:hypothetical protein
MQQPPAVVVASMRGPVLLGSPCMAAERFNTGIVSSAAASSVRTLDMGYSSYSS